MSNNISRRAFLGGSSLLALALAACGGSGDGGSADSGDGATVYKIATDTIFRPFEFTEADGTYVGIDIELLAAVAADQGFEYELDPLGFNAALQALQAGQVDGMIAGMSITPERKEIFDFSDPYFDSNVCAACAPDGGIASLDDLAGLTVAVKTGTMSEKWALSIKDQYGFDTVQFDDGDIMYQDVIAGNSVACFEDIATMGDAIANGVALQIFAQAEADSEFATPYGFAVKKGENAELLAMFNAGLANVKANGTYDEILAKYISVE